MEKFDKKFLQKLEERFKANMHRHKHIKWDFVQSSLMSNEDLYEAVFQMDQTGGEPDLVDLEVFRGLVYVDMAKESPEGRRNLCYDKKAREERKKNPPTSSALEEAEKMGLRLIKEEEYYAIQDLEDLDTKTSSWIDTPDAIRELDGALFCSKKYDRTFTYHNGADSYYQSRGFRACGKI